MVPPAGAIWGGEGGGPFGTPTRRGAEIQRGNSSARSQALSIYPSSWPKSERQASVELTVEEERRELPVGIELSAYRIVPQAITNALEHAGEAFASVHIRYGDTLELEIVGDRSAFVLPSGTGRSTYDQPWQKPGCSGWSGGTRTRPRSRDAYATARSSPHSVGSRPRVFSGENTATTS
jgi:hypothetical protein